MQEDSEKIQLAIMLLFTPENSYYKIVSDKELSVLQKEKGLYHEARRTPNGEIIVRCHKNDKERMLSVIESAAKHLKL